MQRNGFQALALLTTPARTNGKPRISAFFLFAQLNTALVNAGGQPITVPPSAPVYPPTLPKQMTLTCTAVPGRFALNLAAGPYASAVVVYAAESVMAGTNVYRESAFKVIGSLPSLGAGAANLASLYAAAFRAPQAGEKVAIKLMGVSSAGYTTTKQFIAAVTNQAAASGQDTGEDTDEDTSPLQIAA